MLIGVDIDDVLGDVISPILEFHNDRYGTTLKFDDVHSHGMWKVLGVSKEEGIARVREFFQSPYYGKFAPMEGSQRVIKGLSKNHRLVAITSRPSDIHDQTAEWIERHFPGMFSGVYSTNWFSVSGASVSKSDVCTRLGVDVMIEDSPEFAKDCASKGIRVLLFTRPHNLSETPEGATRVDSWDEIERVLADENAMK